MGILFICGALAAGEYAASFAPTFAGAWPAAAMVTVFAALFVHGFVGRSGHLVTVFLLGVTLYLFASVESERLYREQPWLRGARCHARQGSAQAPCVAKVRAELSRRVGIGLGHDDMTASLNRAILLGERSRLTTQMKHAFVMAGTMHVFAISGLHVMAVAKVLVCLLAICCVPRRWAGAIATPVLWGYVYLIGCSPSAVRAALMASFSCLAPIFWRRPNLLRAWALAFMSVHLCSPLMVTNVGNALSFAVMLALALSDELSERTGMRMTSFGSGILVWAAGVPIAAHVFGRITPGGVLANLVLVTVAAWTVLSGAVGVVASFFSETVAAHFNNLSALCTRAMVGISQLVAQVPGASFDVGCWSLLQCVEWYVLIALIVFFVIHRKCRDML